MTKSWPKNCNISMIKNNQNFIKREIQLSVKTILSKVKDFITNLIIITK